MRKLITFTLLLFSCTFSVAQNAPNDYYTPSNSKVLPKDRISGSISAGAGISFLGSSKNTAFTSYLAPKIGYQISNKFKINIGLMHYSIAGNTFMSVNQNEGLFNSSKNNLTGNLLFVEGQYMLNKRVSISGAMMYDENNFSKKQNNSKAVSIGMDYKVTKHSSIGIQATFSQGENPYTNSLMGHPNMGSQSSSMGKSFFGGSSQDMIGNNSIFR